MSVGLSLGKTNPTEHSCRSLYFVSKMQHKTGPNENKKRLHNTVNLLSLYARIYKYAYGYPR